MHSLVRQSSFSKAQGFHETGPRVQRNKWPSPGREDDAGDVYRYATEHDAGLDTGRVR